MSDQKLHPLIEPFRREATARWREREDLRFALEELRDAADEAWQCLDKADRSEHDLAQASAALREMEAATSKLSPERKFHL